MGGILRILLVIAPMFAAGAHAGEIYKWLDDDGVVHYSDTKPADESNVELLVVGKTNPPGYDPADDPYSIANQAERIGETWSRLEDEKEARRKKRREESARPPAYAYRPYDPYYDRYRYPHYRPGWHPPAHPGYRPPQGPTIRRQVTALDTLGLTGARPHSINSGRHHARVESSASFLDTVRNAPPRPVPLN